MWQITSFTGKAMMYPFGKWIDAMVIVAKLRRLGMNVNLVKVEK